MLKEYLKISLRMQRRCSIGLLTLTLFSTPQAITAASLQLPDMGETASNYLSIEDEKRLGNNFMRMVRQSLDILEDPLIEDYIQSLGIRVTTGNFSGHREFNFFVVDSPVVNAFAGPAGNIGIHSGLILTAQSEGELASVVAHEIAHVTQRHLARAVENSAKKSIPLTAAIIAALVLSQADSQLGQAALLGATAGNVQQQINFTRDNEKEADRIGLEILANAGFNPREMPVFFERMLKSSGNDENPYLEFLRTHPLSTSRIADTQNRAEQYPVIAKQDNLTFLLIQARIRALMAEDILDIVNYYPDSKTLRPDEKYGYALGLMRDKQFKKAQEILKKLTAEDPDRIAYQLALADIDISQNNIQSGLDILSRYLELYPRNYPLTVKYAETLIDNRQTNTAKKLINKQLRIRNPTPILYKLLSYAENESGNDAQAYHALAEQQFLIGNSFAAILNIKQALHLLKEDQIILKLKLENRLKYFQGQLEKMEEGH